MKTPFTAWLGVSRAARRGPLSVALRLQRLAMSGAAPAKKKRPKSVGKPVKRRVPVKAKATTRPSPGSFVEGRFGDQNSGLAYKLYTPAGAAARRPPLVVMLHGCAQSAADFATGTRMNLIADKERFLVLYPQQSISANIGRCWNWHRPADQKRGSGEPAAVAALTRHVIKLCGANPARVYIAGLSAGGAAAANIGAAYPDIFAAIGVHSGVAPGHVRSVSGALGAMHDGTAREGSAPPQAGPPIVVFHGDKDTTVHPSNAAHFQAGLRSRGSAPLDVRTEQGRSPGGLDFTRALFRRGGRVVMLEDWTVHGGGHAWSGGSSAGTYTDPAGPDASREMVRFFLSRTRARSAPVA